MPGRSRKVSRKRGGRVNRPLEYFGIPTGRYLNKASPPILKRWVRGGKKTKRNYTKKRKYNKKKRSHCMCPGH